MSNPTDSTPPSNFERNSKPDSLDNLSVKPLTILHTSDWHLGRRLYGQMRYEEFAAFLAWLKATIAQYAVDVLIVAGDVFDTMTPSNQAQQLYYEFLGRVSATDCQHIVIVAGNHDSPTFLDAPAHVLKFLNVHVIGTACEDLADEVLTLEDADGTPMCVVTAVPYLRDRDVRQMQAGESADDKDGKVIAGIAAHYDGVASIAKATQARISEQLGRHVPIVATGHLFAAGGRTTEDDGVRDLYVGNLGKIGSDIFDTAFDYVALGHLHVPQKVGGCEHIRYSGSPIAMGFGEARQQKQVLLVQFAERLALPNLAEADLAQADLTTDIRDDVSHKETPALQSTSQLTQPKSVKAVKAISYGDGFMDDLFAGLEAPVDEMIDKAVEDIGSTDSHDNNASDKIDNLDELSLKTTAQATVLHSDEAKQMHVVSVAVPCWQPLQQITGDMAHIVETIHALPTDRPIWLEVIYNGDEIVSDLREQIQALIEVKPFTVLKTKDERRYNKVLASTSGDGNTETLQDLDELEVFERCMNVHEVADSQKDELREAYSQILYDIRHEDKRAL